jgi:trimeric autotransporter adhesin
MPLERGIVRNLIFVLFLTALLTSGPAALGAGAGITATPAVLQFSYQTGDAALPVAQTLQVQTSPAGLNFTAVVSGAPFNAAWLLVSASAGVGPETLKVEVNPTGLALGSYAGTIAFAAVSGAQTYTQAVAVTLLVSSPVPTLTATPTSLNFGYVTGALIPSPALSSAFILSSSGAALSATVSVTGATWLKVAPTGDVSLIGLFNALSVTVNPAGLAPKMYSGTITISAPGAVNKTTTVAVTLTVDAAVPAVTGL